MRWRSLRSWRSHGPGHERLHERSVRFGRAGAVGAGHLGLSAQASQSCLRAKRSSSRLSSARRVAWRKRGGIFLQLFAAGADVKVAFWIECEVGSREKVPSVRSALSIRSTCGSIPALVHQPPDHLGRAVAPIGDQARRSDVELFSRAVEHCFGRADFGLANGRRRLDVHDRRSMLQIDEVVGGIGITGDGVGRSGVAGAPDRSARSPWARWASPRRTASSSTDRYSATARLDVGSRSSTLATLRRRCASATIMLASTAKASPPTILSFMQRATTVSNSLRRRSLSRNRPWRFLEKVE